MAPLRCAVVGLTGIGTRHALGLVGDERVTLVAGCDDGYVCPPVRCSQFFLMMNIQ